MTEPERLVVRRAPGWALVLVMAASGFAQEQCSNALPFTEGTFAASLGLTADGPPVSCGTIIKDVWGIYTPSCSGIAIVSTSIADGGSTTVPNIIAAYTGTCGAVTEIACARSNLGVFYQDFGSRISFAVTAGVPVSVRIGGDPYVLQTGSGAFTAVILCHPLPANDDCAGAPIIGEGLTIGWTDGATTSAMNGVSCSAISDDLWYQYVPSCTGSAVAGFCPADGGDANFHGEIVAYAGGCLGPLTTIACSKQTPGGCGPRATFPTTAGVPVMLRIGGAAAGLHGAFKLAVSCGPAPPNDTCANPIPVQIGMNGPFSTFGASDDYPPPGGSSCTYLGQQTWSPGYSDVWFSFTSPCGARVKIDLCPTTSGFYPFLSVRPTCGLVGELGCTGACGFVPGATVSVSAGTTYLIRVGSPYAVGWSPAVIAGQGSFTINLTCLWTLRVESPFGPGSVSMRSWSGTPSNPYFTAVTLAVPMTPNFYGIDITTSLLLEEWAFGFPFLGQLDPAGDSNPFVIPVGVPAGLWLHAVSLDLVPLTGQVVQATPPVSFITP